MINNAKSIQKKTRKLRIIVILAFLGFSVMAFLVLYQPRMFWLYSPVIPQDSNVSGKVFKSSTGLFWVRLDSGSQLTVQLTPPKVFLSSSLAKRGFCIGRYLVLPVSALYGTDLSQNEAFARQVPEIKNNTVTLKDPREREGLFSFPLQQQ